jgi:DNA-directed RNA polymerase specialized sigma24 family protein
MSARREPDLMMTESTTEENPKPAEELAQALPRLLPRLWRFALRLARDRDDAEDLVQRACVRTLERHTVMRRVPRVRFTIAEAFGIRSAQNQTCAARLA